MLGYIIGIMGIFKITPLFFICIISVLLIYIIFKIVKNKAIAYIIRGEGDKDKIGEIKNGLYTNKNGKEEKKILFFKEKVIFYSILNKITITNKMIFLFVLGFLIGFLMFQYKSKYIENVYINDYNLQKIKERKKEYKFVKKEKELLEKENKEEKSEYKENNGEFTTFDKDEFKERKLSEKGWKSQYVAVEKERTGDGKYTVYILEKRKNKYTYSYTGILLYSNEKEISFFGNFKISFNSKKEYTPFKMYSIKGRLEKFEEERNYKGLNLKLYNYSRETYFNIVSHNENIKILSDDEILKINKTLSFNNMLGLKIMKYIYSIRTAFKEKLKNINYGEIIVGITIGDTKEISDEDKEIFKNTNIYHILAVSGLHSIYLLSIINYLNKGFKNSKITKNIILILLMPIFMLIAESSSSISRVAIIVFLKSILDILNIPIKTEKLLICSIFLILFINIYKLSDVGLYLSYLATFSIIVLNKYMYKNEIIKNISEKIIKRILNRNKLNRNKVSKKNKRKDVFKFLKVEKIGENILNYILDTILTTTLISLIMWPLIAKFFNILNLNYILSNILLVPIFGVSILFSMINLIILIISNIGAISYFSIINNGFDLVINILNESSSIIILFAMNIAKFLSEFKFLNFYIKEPNIIFLILYYILIYIIYMLFKHIHSFSVSSFSEYKYILLDYVKRKGNILDYLINKYNENYVFFDINKRKEYIQYIENKKERKKKRGEGKGENKNNKENKLIDALKMFYGENIYNLLKNIIIYISIALILSFTILDYSNIRWKNMVSFVDIGQGDASLIMTKDYKNIVIDTGEGLSPRYPAGDKVFFPYLLKRGVFNIDYLIISHFDSDHAGGSLKIIKNLNVKNLVISKQLKITKNYLNIIKEAKNKNVNIMEVKQGDKINVSNELDIQILAPILPYISDNPLNNNSVVNMLIFKKSNKKILYTGDIEGKAEEKIFKDIAKQKIDILKVPHHGSNTSTTKYLLNKISANEYIISCGKLNKFGHPSSLVLKRIYEHENNDVKIRRTDKEGEIQYYFD